MIKDTGTCGKAMLIELRYIQSRKVPSTYDGFPMISKYRIKINNNRRSKVKKQRDRLSQSFICGSQTRTFTSGIFNQPEKRKQCSNLMKQSTSKSERSHKTEKAFRRANIKFRISKTESGYTNRKKYTQKEDKNTLKSKRKTGS